MFAAPARCTTALPACPGLVCGAGSRPGSDPDCEPDCEPTPGASLGTGEPWRSPAEFLGAQQALHGRAELGRIR